MLNAGGTKNNTSSALSLEGSQSIGGDIGQSTCQRNDEEVIEEIKQNARMIKGGNS